MFHKNAERAYKDKCIDQHPNRCKRLHGQEIVMRMALDVIKICNVQFVDSGNFHFVVRTCRYKARKYNIPKQNKGFILSNIVPGHKKARTDLIAITFPDTVTRWKLLRRHGGLRKPSRRRRGYHDYRVERRTTANKRDVRR